MQSIRNKLENVAALDELFKQPLSLQLAADDNTGGEEQKQIDEQHRAAAQALIKSVHSRWQAILERLDQPLSDCADLISSNVIGAGDGSAADEQMPKGDQPLIQAFLVRSVVVSLRAEVERPLKDIFTGRRYLALRNLSLIHI